VLAAIVAISCEEAEPEIITTDLPSEQSDRTPGGIGVIDTEAKLERAIDDLYYVYHGAYEQPTLFFEKLKALVGADDLTTTSADKLKYCGADVFDGSSNYKIEEFFTAHYSSIYGMQYFIERIDEDAFSEEVLNNAIAQARFYRGVMLFDMALMFGDGNLILNTKEEAVEATVEDILLQVIADMEFANEWLAYNSRDDYYVISAQEVSKRGSKTAAKAFLAKAHLAMAGWPVKKNVDANYAKVKKHTKAIIDEGIYELLDDYAHNFGNLGQTYIGISNQEWEGNKEAIWSRVCEQMRSGTLGSGLYGQGPFPSGCFNGNPWGAWGDYAMEWHFYENMRKDYRASYSATDRLTWTYAGFTKYPFAYLYEQPVVTKFMWGCIVKSDYRKYSGIDLYASEQDVPTPESFGGFEHAYNCSNDLPVMRFSEVVLMYAEACAHAGETVEAIEKLNWIRRRAYAGGLPCVKGAIGEAISNGDLSREYWRNPEPAIDYPQPGESDLMKAIIDERAWEFVGELCGVRWFDLTRLEMVEEALSKRDDRDLPLVGNPGDKSLWRINVN